MTLAVISSRATLSDVYDKAGLSVVFGCRVVVAIATRQAVAPRLERR